VFSGRVEPRRTAFPVFPRPPLKFRTASFPQYGFKRTFKPATFVPTSGLSAVHIRPPASLIRWLSVRTRLTRQILRLFAVVVLTHFKPWLESCDSIGHDDSHPPRVRPEALGSPKGYAVLPGHRLLWPHPRLWIRNRAISAFPAIGARGIRPKAAIQRVPNLLRKTVRPCHLPYPGGFVIAYGCCFITNSGLRLRVRGSASAMCIFEAAEFA
jgi:hypothetical protein